MTMIGNVPFTYPIVHGPFGPQHTANVQVNVPQQLLPAVVPYAIAVLNTAYGLHQQSYGRTFFFNLLAANNFTNQALNTTVDLAFRIGWFALTQRQFAALDQPQNIEAAVGFTLASLTSEQILQHAQLQGGVGANQINAIRQAYQQFQQAKGQYYQINFQELNMVGGQVTTAQYQPGSAIAAPAIVSTIATGGQLAGAVDKFNEWEQASQPSQPAAGATPLLGVGTYTQEETVIPPTPMGEMTTQPAQPVNGMTTEHGMAPVARRYSAYRSLTIDRPTYPSTIVSHQGYHEMDLTKHAVAYFGSHGIHGFSAEDAMKGVQGAAFEMHNNNTNKVAKADRLTVEEIGMHLTLQDLFASVRLHQRRLSRKRGREMFLTRVMGVVVNHNYSTRIMQELLPSIYEGKLEDMGHRLAKAVGCSDPKNPTSEQHERLVAAAFIDRMMGVVTNDYLARGLRTPASIITFTDSIEECAHFVKTTLPETFGVMFLDFLNTLTSNLKKFSTPDHLANVAALAYGDLPEGEEMDENDGVVIVPVAHTVTLVNVTSQELGWKMQYQGSVIDPKVTPTLDTIVSTLRADKSAFDFKSSYDWILTGDGEYYQVYESPEDPGNFRMYPVSGLNLNNLKTT